MQIAFGRVRRKTAPTGPGKNRELPKYFLKLHQTSPAVVDAFGGYNLLKCLLIYRIHHRLRLRVHKLPIFCPITQVSHNAQWRRVV